MRVPDVVRHALCCLAPRLARMAPVRAAERAGGDDLILEGLRGSFVGPKSAPFPPGVARRLLLSAPTAAIG